jgi:hypothetical protein
MPRGTTNWRRKAMKIFSSRFDHEYLSFLESELSIEHLLTSSFKIFPHRKRGGKKFDKHCRIDFMGLAATTLLDIGCNFSPNNTVPKQFEKLMKNVKKLNDEGIFVKIRFLFSYPFSMSFLSLIQAETTTYRASIEAPAFLRDFRIIDEIDDETFSSSSTVQNQRNGLEHLQQLIDTYHWDDDDSPNTVRVRFTPIDVNYCMLILNDSIFYDPYLYSKTSRMSKKLALCAPVVSIQKGQDEITFKNFEDHFRYLWDLDTTLVCNDATHYVPGVPNTLRRIKSPNQVTYDHKADRIRELRFEQSKLESTDEEIRSWKFRVRNILHRFSSNTKPAPNIESVFIACSWREGLDGRSSPNEYAKQLASWLENDFGYKRDIPLMTTHILEAAAGGSLANQIYARLREATMAIVILTSDIKGESGIFYSKPNIYHELGYLMRQIDSNRLVIIRENDAHLPTNISDIVHIDLASKKLALCYREIVLWIKDNCFLTNTKSIKYSLEIHNDRLKEMIVDGQLAQVEGDQAINRIIHTLEEMA